MQNIKNAKILSIARYHNVLTEMFTITEKSVLIYEKVKFLTSPNPSKHHRLPLFLQVSIIVCAWYNLKSRGRLLFNKNMYSSLDTGKVQKYMVTAYMHLFRSRVQLYSSILGFN